MIGSNDALTDFICLAEMVESATIFTSAPVYKLSPAGKYRDTEQLLKKNSEQNNMKIDAFSMAKRKIHSFYFLNISLTFS